MRALPLFTAALLLAVAPVAAQDIFQPLEDFVEDLLPQAPPRATPRPVSPAPPTPAEERPEAEAELGPPLPRPRPEAIEAEVEPEPEQAPAATGPDRIYQTACPALLSGIVVGEMLPPIAEGMCGERSPLSITAIRAHGSEIGLSSPVTTNCAMAGALADWAGEVDAYAISALGSPVARIDTGTSFFCRNRYNAENGFVSEHGFANAVDVTGFTLEDGRSIAVETDWLPAATPEGRLLRQAHGAACGRLTTVLGPEANAEHEDHLHLDLGCHGQSCMARICQ